MQINDDILHDFTYCEYKAFLRYKHQKGILSDYQHLYNQLKENQKFKFEKTLSSNLKLIPQSSTFNASISQKGVLLNVKFNNENIDLSLDAIEFAGNKKIFPIFITPFEKVTKTDKLFIALQASFILREFDLPFECCKIFFGINLKQTKFRLSLFAKRIKKIIFVLNKILIPSSNAPIFFKNGHCQICEFQKNCFEKLVERDDLSLLAGLKSQEILSKNNRGIFSVKQLSYTFRPKRNPYRKRKFIPELKALAIREGKTFIQEIPDIPISPNEIFLDIEGIPDRNFYYLIGAIIKTNDSETSYSFWANNENEEENIFIELFTLLQSLHEFTIYHYGSYEIQALRKLSKSLLSEYQEFIKKIIDCSFNLLKVLTNNIYPPTYSNSLKDIARYLSFDWSEKKASGLQSIVWRYDWEICQNEALKHKLIQYNLEDCKALMVVKDWIKTIDKSEENHFASNLKSENIFKWGITDYIIKEFEEINSRSYFEYQREHIFLRTEKKVYRAINKQKQNTKINNKPDRRINLFPSKCPYCKGRDIIKIRVVEKLQVDIAFMKQGIKKRATLFTGGPAICGKCKRKIPSTDMKQLPMYGHNLMIWSVNQKIQYKQSSEHISNFLKDSFNIEVSRTQMTRFKEQIAKRYLPTYKEIITEITKSELIHVDETIARIKGIDGYVWVFANYDSVYYEFRETRETDFLKELLKNFKGVLVSDFYTGYDFLECNQQKCMIHLIRDLNEDFLKNQFDIELKTIVIEFGKLLRSIISTIDKFGLKQIHLNKHKKDVESFYSNVISQRFESEFALSYQKRFTKYKEKLFQFLQCDNIPWNNNNAEHSIKPFAKWRKKISKSLTKQNIEHHLVLLSILQTCKYRGINFFKFLKSGEMSIFDF